MSNYKAPEPEMHNVDPELDIRPGKTVWYVTPKCLVCDLVPCQYTHHPKAEVDRTGDADCEHEWWAMISPVPFPAFSSWKALHDHKYCDCGATRWPPEEVRAAWYHDHERTIYR